MNTSRYCEEHVRTAFPCFFYALLFLPLQQRQACMAVFAFYHEIFDIVYNISDHGVAHKKLHFWHEELQRYTQHKSRHPVMVELQAHHQCNDIQEKCLLALLHGCAFDISPEPILNQQDFQEYKENHMGALQHLLCDILGCHSQSAITFLDTLSQAWQYMHCLQQLHLDVRRKHLLLPQQDRVSFKVSDAQMFQAELQDNSRALFQHYDQRIQQLCQQAENLLQPDDRKAIRPLIVITQLLQQQWQQTLLNPFQATQTMLPLKRIWRSWHTNHIEKKAVTKNQPIKVQLS